MVFGGYKAKSLQYLDQEKLYDKLNIYSITALSDTQFICGKFVDNQNKIQEEKMEVCLLVILIMIIQ